MNYFCCDEQRRNAVRIHKTLNGINFLEVRLDQRELTVNFLKPYGDDITSGNVLITGGERIKDIRVIKVKFTKGSDKLKVTVNTPGDFSTYTLSLVTANSNIPLQGLDQLLYTVDFSFKVDCSGDFDCRENRVCPPAPSIEPDIDYLAKDYASFRQLMLDRLSVLMPEWKERNPADLGVALVELMAYVGDRLSYQQDAIATEAYLGTSQRRISVRRHARLVDYFMHDGCNARVWVQVQVNQDIGKLPKGTKLLTKSDGLEPRIKDDPSIITQAVSAGSEVFETMHDVTLFAVHNEIHFYTWGARECCLPKGATSATLCDKDSMKPRLSLSPGDILIFKEKINPETGKEEDADLLRRHAVRLKTVSPNKEDMLTKQPYIEIEWDAEDALPFPFCISAITNDGKYKENISVALGNIVLADHGLTLKDENIGEVPLPDTRMEVVQTSTGNRCEPNNPDPMPYRFRPRLGKRPLTQTATVKRTETVDGCRRRMNFDPAAPASRAFQWDMDLVIPAIELTDWKGDRWHPQRDMVSSDEFAREFVVEVESDGSAILRFGDDSYGLLPPSGTVFTARYRVGNGTRGNIGADAMRHIVTGDSRIESVCNPMPAKGGVDAESIEHVRQNAPAAFRIHERAVTPDDYALMAERHTEVQSAEATIRWTGSWHTIFLTIDRFGGKPVDADFEEKIRKHLERFRMAGQDIEIDGPQFVPLEIEIEVCVKPAYFRSDVKAALLEVFSNAILPDGQRGFFHPDKFTFGQPVYLSQLYAAAQHIEGVHYVELIKFQRLGIESEQALNDGELKVGRKEIVCLDNDPNFPERGILRLDMKGGR